MLHSSRIITVSSIAFLTIAHAEPPTTLQPPLNVAENQSLSYSIHYPDIAYEPLRKAINANEVFLIDANSPSSYQKGHLPNAYSLHHVEKLQRAMPSLKSYPIVVYCGGSQCSAWNKAADFARASGYTNVMHFKGGVKEWKASGNALVSGSDIAKN